MEAKLINPTLVTGATVAYLLTDAWPYDPMTILGSLVEVNATDGWAVVRFHGSDELSVFGEHPHSIGCTSELSVIDPMHTN